MEIRVSSKRARLDGNVVIIFVLRAARMTISVLWAMWVLKVIACLNIVKLCEYMWTFSVHACKKIRAAKCNYSRLVVIQTCTFYIKCMIVG